MIIRIFMLLLGVLFFLPMAVLYLFKRKSNAYSAELKKVYKSMEKSGERKSIEEEVNSHTQRKLSFFGRDDAESMKKEADRVLEIRLNERARQIMREEKPQLKASSFTDFVISSLERTPYMAWLAILGLPSFLFIILMSNPFIKYIFERLIMMVFVVFGVTFLVFTILYVSPMDASYNILGELATQDQRDAFNAAYGLDRSYGVQLLNAFKGIATLNPGKSYVGGENVIETIVNRFPVTLKMTFASLGLAVLLAVPSGILSSLKPYSILDYVVMLFALIGLSIPAFWFGNMLILTFSIKLGLLSALFEPGKAISFLMPAIVMGTGLSASVARMTRSSMLEVLNQDYIVTAKAKGLSRSKVVIRHALGNAMIPIITVIGIQFGSMLGGATVVEKVFNMPGIGSWLVDKQFIPDIPAVLAGVVYISIVASLVNLFVDVLYAFLDPRIKAKIKGY